MQSNKLTDLDNKLSTIEKYKNTSRYEMNESIFPTESDLEDEIINKLDSNLKEKYRNFKTDWILEQYELFIDRYDQLIKLFNDLRICSERIVNIWKMVIDPGYGITKSDFRELNKDLFIYVLDTYSLFYERLMNIKAINYSEWSDGNSIDEYYRCFQDLMTDTSEESSLIKEQVDNLYKKIMLIYEKVKVYSKYERYVSEEFIKDQMEKYSKENNNIYCALNYGRVLDERKQGTIEYSYVGYCECYLGYHEKPTNLLQIKYGKSTYLKTNDDESEFFELDL